MKNNTINVKRHSLLYRVLHWTIVAEILLLIVSGMGVSEYVPLSFISRGAARSFHIVLGLAWAGTATFFVYYFVMSGEYKWFGISRIGYAFDFFMHEVKCLVEGKKVPHPVKYDEAKKKYVEKIVPTEVLAWWGWFTIWTIMALTGLAILFPASFGFINRLTDAIIPRPGDGVMATRLIHVAVSMVIIVYILIHAYASWTFGMVGSMVSGRNDEPVADKQA